MEKGEGALYKSVAIPFCSFNENAFDYTIYRYVKMC